MKKTVLAVVAAVLLTSFVAEKFIVVKMKEEQMNYHWQNLGTVKQIINASQLPHQQALFCLQAIDSLQRDIQLNAALDSTVTNPPLKLGKK